MGIHIKNHVFKFVYSFNCFNLWLWSSDRLLIVGSFENWFDENGRLTEYLLFDRENNNLIHCESIENPLQIDCLIFINDNEKNQQNSPFSKQQYLETFQNQLNSFK